MNTTSHSTILVVEDDTSIRRSLRSTLQAMGFTLLEASSGEEALSCLESNKVDAVLLDLNMPGMGGLEACRTMRQRYPLLPILVVSVRDTEQDIVRLLDAGADGYIVKPFHLREVAARLRAAIRRGRLVTQADEPILRIGIFELDPNRRRVRKAGCDLRFTPTEFDLLQQLMSHAGRPVRHEQLLHSVWGPEFGGEREYLRTYIMQLRRKIEDDPASPAFLLTDNYFGYRFYDPEMP